MLKLPMFRDVHIALLHIITEDQSIHLPFRDRDTNISSPISCFGAYQTNIAWMVNSHMLDMTHIYILLSSPAVYV